MLRGLCVFKYLDRWFFDRSKVYVGVGFFFRRRYGFGNIVSIFGGSVRWFLDVDLSCRFIRGG